MVLAAVFLAACGDPSPEQRSSQPAEERYVPILSIEGGDRAADSFISISYAINVLNHYGIPFDAGGSISLSVAVPATSASRAEALLQVEHTGLRGFVTWLRSGEKDAVPALRHAEERISSSYREALLRYPENMTVGRVLRHPTIVDLVRTGMLAYVEGVKWSERPYVTADLSEATAVAARIEYSRGQPRASARPGLQHRDVAIVPD